MKELETIVSTVARQVVGEVNFVRHELTTPIGEHVFVVKCDMAPRQVTVTLNPNGKKASVEWRSGKSGKNYKVCSIHGAKVLSDTSEEKAVKETGDP